MSKIYGHYLEKVVNCPKVEKGKSNTPCSDVIVDSWVNLLGWGNPKSRIVFVGINPMYNAEAHKWHTPPLEREPFEHAKIRSAEGASHARHFSYHKRILRELKEADEYLRKILPDTINDFAFYTEVAFCPSTDQAKLNDIILNKCFETNVKPFITDSSFQVVIALGRIPSDICVRSFIGIQAVAELSNYHGKVFQIHNQNKYLITSYHPNAFGKWDRSAVAHIILDLHNKGKISLG